MTREEQINDKARELAKKFFPDGENIWARENIEAIKVELACLEMAKWLQEGLWISVEDELPPIEWVYSDLVLVTDGERYHLGLYNHESGDWFDVDFVPTHWMPLPQQPKKGKYIMTKEEK